MGSTTVRISEKDRLKLQTLSKALRSRSLGSTFGEVLKFVESRKEEFLSSLKKVEKEDSMVALLREAKGKYGKTSAKKVDEYIYRE